MKDPNLLYVDGDDLSAGYYVVDWGGGFVHAGLAHDDHVLRPAHAFHHVHHLKRQGGHHFVFDHRLRIGFQQRDVDARSCVLFVEQGNGRAKVEASTRRSDRYDASCRGCRRR